MNHPITKAREAAGLSVEGLAYKVGVSYGTIRNIEKGRCSPSVSTALAIARLLDCTVEELFSEEGAA